MYSGETNCNNCYRKAYYTIDNLYYCGYHGDKTERVKMQKNPNINIIRANRISDHVNKCDMIAHENKMNNIKGNIICSKMKMFGEVELIEGYINIFPNYKHGNRKDGMGFPSLSPKSIGPINHGQPGLPISLNLENFHQGNKVYENEVDANGEPTELFFEIQKKMYCETEPFIHKSDYINTTNTINCVNKQKTNKNVKNTPLYSIWVSKDKIHKVSYFESRQFYCTFYEREIINNADFLKLKKLIENGYNLRIVGYDAYNVTKSIEEHYKDITKPFGHELVLYSMMIVFGENIKHLTIELTFTDNFNRKNLCNININTSMSIIITPRIIIFAN